MEWQVHTKKSVLKSLKKIEFKDQKKLVLAISDLSENPFLGDVKALKGGLKNLYRKRVGSWRILYFVDTEIKIVDVVDVKRRTSKTYS